METSRFESLTLVAAIIGAAVLSSQSLGIGFGAAAVGDVAILLALFAFDNAATRSGPQSIAFAAVSAYCLLTPLIFMAVTILGVSMPAPPTNVYAKDGTWTILIMWLVATLILFAVDRFRMSSRDNVSLAGSGLSGTGPIQPIKASSPASTYRPAPIRVEPPLPPPPVYTPPPPSAVPEPTLATPAAIAAPAPVFAAATSTTTPDVMAIPPGREALIYLNLVGEGLNVLRTVRAENLGRDYYRIADVMPEGEQWEFAPGMVVRCRKKNLSNGKHMVAYEEAPRA